MEILDCIFFIVDLFSDLFIYRNFESWITVVAMHYAEAASFFAAVLGFAWGYPVIGIIGLAGTVYFGVMEYRYFRKHLEERRSGRSAAQNSQRK